MNYFVIGPDGQKYGPADIATLSAWIRENRLTPTTQLEDAATGQRLMASSVAGLQFPGAAMSPPPSPYSEPQAGSGHSPVSPYTRHSHEQVPNHLPKAIFATVCCCLVGGIVSIIFAAQVNGHSMRGDIMTARKYAAKANTWADWSIGVGLVINAMYLMVNIASSRH